MWQRGARSGDELEESVSQFFSAWVDSGEPGRTYLLRRPMRVTRVALAASALPKHAAVLGDEGDGSEIRTTLTRPSGFGRVPLLRDLKSLLVLPTETGSYSLGASKQTLRRKSRAAVRGGASWRRIDDPAERRSLLATAAAYEREHPDERHRGAREPELDASTGVWLAAFDGDGQLLLLSVTLVSGEWALLRYFRAVGGSELSSNARYYMTEQLVDVLVELRVRYLVDTISPAHLPNGLRHFQRMLGWRVARVPVRSAH